MYYPQQGKDADGNFKIVRTIKEFYMLYDTLIAKWPGIYIPPVPPTSIYEEIETIRYIIEGEKDNRFFNERRYFIQQFFCKVPLFPFIVKSRELQYFLRGKGDYSQFINSLQSERPTDILTKYKVEFKIKEDNDLFVKGVSLLGSISSYCDNLEKLIGRVDEIVSLNEKFKGNLFDTVDSYVKLLTNINNFEKEQIIESNSVERQKAVFAKDPYLSMIMQIRENAGNFIAPFKFLEFWSKEEKYELTALKKCYIGISDLLIKKKELLKKISNERDIIDKLNKGEFTFSLLGIINSVRNVPKEKSIEESEALIVKVPSLAA